MLGRGDGLQGRVGSCGEELIPTVRFPGGKARDSQSENRVSKAWVELGQFLMPCPCPHECAWEVV